MKTKKTKKPKIRELKLGPLWEERNQEFYLRLQKLARSTEPADRELMEGKVRHLYQAWGKDEPQIFWCDSPLQVFVIPYLIDRFGKSSDLSYEEFWTEAEKKYFSLLAPDILQYLNLGAWQNRLSTHFPLSGPSSYRPRDTVIDVAQVLYLQKRNLFRTVTWYLGPTYVQIPHNQRGRDAFYPWDFSRLADFYDGVNNRLYRDINRPPLLEYEMLIAASGNRYAQYRDDMPSRAVSTLIEEWITNFARLPDTAVARELWSAFLPDFVEDQWNNGFGYFALWHLLYKNKESLVSRVSPPFERVLSKQNTRVRVDPGSAPDG